MGEFKLISGRVSGGLSVSLTVIISRSLHITISNSGSGLDTFTVLISGSGLNTFTVPYTIC